MPTSPVSTEPHSHNNGPRDGVGNAGNSYYLAVPVLQTSGHGKQPHQLQYEPRSVRTESKREYVPVTSLHLWLHAGSCLADRVPSDSLGSNLLRGHGGLSGRCWPDSLLAGCRERRWVRSSKHVLELHAILVQLDGLSGQDCLEGVGLACWLEVIASPTSSP
jgi:hypothetical protein